MIGIAAHSYSVAAHGVKQKACDSRTRRIPRRT
jgi:hypothetical protein